MIDLSEYEGKNVHIVDDEGKSWEGYNCRYENADELDSDEDAIIVRIPKFGDRLVEFSASEIKLIELLD